MKISLSTYTIRVNKKREHDKDKETPAYCKLSSFDGYTDLFSVILDFLQNNLVSNTNIKNDLYKSYIKISELVRKERIISGIVESGHYGVPSKIRDVETDLITYKKKRNDADVLPFYFLFYLPKDTNEGILILQRTGIYGVRTDIGSFLNKHFSSKYKNFLMEINTLVNQEQIKKLLYKGVIKKLRCVKYSASRDRFDGLDEGHEEFPLDIEIVLSANRIPFINKIKEFFDSNCSVKNLIELRDFNFDYDTVKIDLEINGSLRTVDLSYLPRVRNSFDISDKIVRGDDGQPTFQSIHEVSYDYLQDIIEIMYP
ncbi:MAG: hypothetical protein VKL41_06880 [Snowella sp.]|nr:hypothetical protein [Snowella sp.]